MYDVVYWWLDWGAIVCMVSSVFVAALVVFHATSRRVHNLAGVVVVLLAPLLILPSLVLKGQLDLPAVADLRLSELRQLAATLLVIGSFGWISGGIGAIGHFSLATAPPVTRFPPAGLHPWLDMWDGVQHQLQPIDAPSTSIGRDYQNQVILGNADVSRVHALIERQGNRLFLIDLFSRHGTYVNNQRVSGRVELHPLDVLQFGSMATARLLLLAG